MFDGGLEVDAESSLGTLSLKPRLSDTDALQAAVSSRIAASSRAIRWAWDDGTSLHSSVTFVDHRGRRRRRETILVTEDQDAPHNGRPAVEWVISGLVALVAVGGAIAIATALLLFMPGTNGLDAGEVEEILSAAPPATTAPATTVVEPTPDATPDVETPSTAASESLTTTPPITTPVPTTQSTTIDDSVVEADDPSVEVAEARIVAYRVRRGDTLSLIGEAFGVDWRELAVINGLADPNVLASGQVLQVPVVDAIANIAAVTDPDLVALAAVFDSAAEDAGVAPELLKAVVWVDTGWGTLSEDGAIAPLDSEAILSLAEAALGDLPDRSDPAGAIAVAAVYLADLFSQADGDASAAAAAYFERIVSTRDIEWGAETVSMVGDMLAVRPVFVIN